QQKTASQPRRCWTGLAARSTLPLLFWRLRRSSAGCRYHADRLQWGQVPTTQEITMNPRLVRPILVVLTLFLVGLFAVQAQDKPQDKNKPPDKPTQTDKDKPPEKEKPAQAEKDKQETDPKKITVYKTVRGMKYHTE